MRGVAIVQARMSSTRLPGKVLLPLAGKPVLHHVISRLKQCKTLDDIVIATSDLSSEDPISDWCEAHKIYCYRGSLNDVLDRYYQAALKFEADFVVRITSDCPAIDPIIVDEVVDGFLSGGFDSYSLSGEFPDGLDCQVFKFSALKDAWLNATKNFEREHVGPYIEKTHPEKFKLGGLEKFHGLSHHRWTLDEQADFDFLTAIFERLYPLNPYFSSEEILLLLEKDVDLLKINQGIVRNEGYIKSIQAEID